MSSLHETVLDVLKTEEKGLSVPALVQALEKSRDQKVDDIKVRQAVWSLISKGRLNLSEDWLVSFAK